MRVLVVSAHYPPNFVSGGTLVPQRLAQGLLERGHDVSVYAGWLGDQRAPLDTWSETDETGLPVRWIATTPWIDWSDTRNYDNPAVTAAFDAHLADVRPEVVHFHSLQSLGAGLLGAARRRGARIAVTMHDFWWLCARQFLVDRHLHPCSLVVDAGACECQVDRTWLEERCGYLRGQIELADVVLAPSRSAAQVFEANGLATGRLRVEENGFPEQEQDQDGRPAATASDEPVRFVYTGGSDPLKGVHDLFAATRLLAQLPGWTLRAYGADRHVREAQPDVADFPVEVLPPFGPEGLEAVLSWADVAVVPSVMRESHSMVTREALARHLAVICTDTLGPEEVVEHGTNGLVVPAGDARALAAAMSTLISDRQLLARFRSHPVPPIRKLSDQIDSIETTLASLVALSRTPPAPASRLPSPTSVRRVLFVCGIEGAPLRYRARLPAEALALLGISSEVRHYRDPQLHQLAAHADAVVFYRVPATVQILGLIESIKGRRTPVLLDVDDLIFDPDLADEIPALQVLPADEAELWMQGVHRYRTTMEACDMFVGATEPLCAHAREVTGLHTERFANGVGLALGRLSESTQGRDRSPGPVRVGYLSGTITHDRDWGHVEPAVVEVLYRHPDAELWLIGHVTSSAALDLLGHRVRRIPWQPWHALPGVLRDLDVNLAPLEPGSRFNEAKSAIKWLEAGLAATPTVASPTQPFAEAICHGVNGLLAGEVEDWVACLEQLLDDETARHRLGRRARRDALLRWAPHLQARRYVAILETAGRLVGDGQASRSSTWRPVALDEPPIQARLEPYLPGPPREVYVRTPAKVTTPLARLADLWRRGRSVWMEEGCATATRAAMRLLRRKGARVRGHWRADQR